MKQFDVSGVFPQTVPLDASFGMKGYRIIPILTAAETEADAVAAYAALQIDLVRNSNSRAQSGSAPGITDTLNPPGPDWVRCPGFNQMRIVTGQAGRTYRVFIAEDCYEVVDAASPPYMNGFMGGGTSGSISPTTTSIGPGGAGTQTQNSAAGNIPTAAGDGVLIPPGIKGAYVDVEAPAGQTISAVTTGMVWWRYSAAKARWGETSLQEIIATGARDASGIEQAVNGKAGDRLYVEARSVATSGGGALTVRLSIF